VSKPGSHVRVHGSRAGRTRITRTIQVYRLMTLHHERSNKTNTLSPVLTHVGDMENDPYLRTIL
ncbi:MAG: hypothetical protein JSV20_04925, partial [Candidatus Bathyarchaeota archaeon]